MLLDIACAAAIEYETSYKASGFYKDQFGNFWTTFAYSDVLEGIIEDYQCGDFRVTVPGFVEYFNNYISVYKDDIVHFDDPTFSTEES